MGWGDKHVTHRVEKSGSLFNLLSAVLTAYNRRTDTFAGGMKAIALALSTPQDNSTEVQKHIDALTSRVDTQVSTLDNAVDNVKET